MNKNIKTYLLLVAFIGVWGLIAYKFFTTLNPEFPKESSGPFLVNFKPAKTSSIDTFSIEVSSRDPFLGTLYTERKASYKQKQSVEKAENTPKITYGGIIKKQQSNQQVFVLNINNNQYLLKKGQTADSIKLLRGNSKAVFIRYKNKTLIIPIE